MRPLSLDNTVLSETSSAKQLFSSTRSATKPTQKLDRRWKRWIDGTKLVEVPNTLHLGGEDKGATRQSGKVEWSVDQ